MSSEKKQLSSVKENEESGRASSAVKSTDRVLRSVSKENEKSSETFEVILDWLKSFKDQNEVKTNILIEFMLSFF